MTQTATLSQDIPLLPASILAHLIATLLAPMFLPATGGDLAHAHLGALETLKAHRARNHIDLIAIAQIVGCGLAALGSVSRSMEDDLSLSMTLRLRGNAVTLNRAVEHARRALGKTRPDLEPVPSTEPDPADLDAESAVLSSVADTGKRVEQANARLQVAKPATISAPPENPTLPSLILPSLILPSLILSEQHRQASWASAMSDVANEFTASLPHLPPRERKLATLRAAALSSCANQLLSGEVSPRPGPGDLAALMRLKPG